ncbi:MAG: hypothetical protein KF773_11810 [Deltaproteobacteria bacterium]|nr:hypothetical protein [Deltaproteobacteria bacterium]MCW5805067.1 hypothetical protein [Deltaproteobacteria bacterium]
MRNILIALVAAAIGTGCYATGGVAYTGTVTAVDVQPDLVYVSPGVQVIADYDDSIFYSDGFYWRFSGGYWHRSSYHNRGWAVYRTPPSRIVSIREPARYHRYRPTGWQPRHQPARDHRGPAYSQPRRNEVRDHRAPAPTTYSQPRRGEVRDHRAPAPTTYAPARKDSRDHRAPAPAPAKKKRGDDRDHRK